MDFRSSCFLWWMCIGDSRWVAFILNCCVCKNHVSSSSAFLWDVAVLLFLLYFLFLAVYHCVHFLVVIGTVGTGCCSAIGVEVVVGRETGCWVDKGRGGVSGKERGGLLVSSRGGCECWLILVLISRMLLSGMRIAVQLILQVSYFRGKVLNHVLHVGILLFCLG